MGTCGSESQLFPPGEEKYTLSVPYLKSLALDMLYILKYLHVIMTYLGDGAEA